VQVRYRYRIYPRPAQHQGLARVFGCARARRAYRNWFGSLSGCRKGRKIGHPRRRARQALDAGSGTIMVALAGRLALER
jgi:hypothetical protein